MPRKKSRVVLSPLNIIGIAASLFVWLVGELLSDRLTGWGNKVIDDYLAKHQGEFVAWVFANPFNLMQALAVIVFLLILIDVYYHYQRGERKTPQNTISSNIPPEYYVPKPEELKNKINIEAQTFYRKFKSFIYTSGKNRKAQYDIALEVIKNIWEDSLPYANRIFKNTPIPNLIDEIYSLMIRWWTNWSVLQEEYEEKNRWIDIRQPIPIEVRDRIAQWEIELDQIIGDIDSKINHLIDLTSEIEK